MLRRIRHFHIFLILSGLVFLVIFLGNKNYSKSPSKPAPSKKTWQDEQFSSWDGSHRECVKITKKLLNDPNSFKHVKTVFVDTTQIDPTSEWRAISMQFRAKNAFNATITQTWRFRVDLKGNVIRVVDQQGKLLWGQ